MIYVNAGFRRIFGEDDSLDLSAAHLLTFVPEADQRRAAKIASMFQQGLPTRTELTITRRNGEVRWVRVVDDPVFDEDGVAIRAAGTIEDITERKLAEEAARASRVEAEVANAAKDAFLSRMSHELRTPLNAVLGFAQLLELDGLSPTQREAVTQILRGGKHLLAMIDDVLDITSIESDRLVPSLEPVDVVELVAETVELMQPLAAAHSVTLRVDAGTTEPPLVRADRLRLRQVLLNLVSNAVKYNTARGHVDIGITPVGDRQVSVSVADTGIGIAPDDQARLFEPFERLGHQSSTIEGTGIGLTLSRRLTTLMGGRLDVRSIPNSGSTFTITLPISDAAPTDQATAGEDSVAVEPAPLTVLYIEDNTSNVDLVAGIVQRRPGWSLTHAATGHEGLDLAGALAPTVVLLDLHLPDLDGIDVLRALRANPVTAGLPVAILSADAGPIQVRRLLDAGAEIYLTKPLDVRQVLTFLDAHAG